MLPVCFNGKLVGMLTLRDLTMRATAQGRYPAASKVREVMTREVVYCFESQDVRSAARIMERRQLPQLPVLDRDWRLVGVVSVDNLKRNGGRIQPFKRTQGEQGLKRGLALKR